MTPRSRLFACAALVVGFGLVAAPVATPADLPKDATKAAAAADVVALQKKLDELAAAEKPAGGGIRTARGLALTLIAYGDDATKAQAAKVLVGLKDKDIKAGLAAGKDLANPKADPGALKGIDKAYTLDDVMSPFRLARAGTGGLNIEKDIREGIKSGKMVPADAVIIGARSAALAEYAAKLPVEKALTNATMKAKWERWSKDMATAGKELCEAGGKSDAKAIVTALKKLDGSCNNCHNDFKE